MGVYVGRGWVRAGGGEKWGWGGSVHSRRTKAEHKRYYGLHIFLSFSLSLLIYMRISI